MWAALCHKSASSGKKESCLRGSTQIVFWDPDRAQCLANSRCLLFWWMNEWVNEWDFFPVRIFSKINTYQSLKSEIITKQKSENKQAVFHSTYVLYLWILKTLVKNNQGKERVAVATLPSFLLGSCLHSSSLRIQRTKGAWEMEDKADKYGSSMKEKNRETEHSDCIQWASQGRAHVNKTWRMRRIPLRENVGRERVEGGPVQVSSIEWAMAPPWEYLCLRRRVAIKGGWRVRGAHPWSHGNEFGFLIKYGRKSLMVFNLGTKMI